MRTHHLLLDHLRLLPHAEAPVVLGPLGAVVRLTRGGVDGRPAWLGRTSASSSSSVVIPATVVVTSSSSSTTASVRDECLPWESSVTRALRKIIG